MDADAQFGGIRAAARHGRGAMWTREVVCGAAVAVALLTYPIRASAQGEAPAPHRSLASALHTTDGTANTPTVDQESASDASSSTKTSLPEAPRAQTEPYESITGDERLKWIATSTLGFPCLAGGVISAAFGTAVNHPHEDGTHWGGFAERYGMRLTGVITSNTMEAGLGAIWGEDPRYLPHLDKPLGGRVRRVVLETFEARRRDGSFAPAYARFLAITGSNFLSNSWRPDSEADSYHAVIRTLEGLGDKMADNAWREFWPSVRSRVFHRRE